MSATNTELFLTNNELSNVSVVQEAVRRLGAEVNPDADPHQGSAEYRKALVSALLYKVKVLDNIDDYSI